MGCGTAGEADELEVLTKVRAGAEDVVGMNMVEDEIGADCGPGCGGDG